MSVNTVKNDGSLLRVAGGTLYADAPIGAEFGYEGSTIPNGYLACDGSAITQEAYPELYAVIGGTLPNKADTIIKAKQVAVPFDVAEFVKAYNSPDWDNATNVITYVQDESGTKTYTVIDDGFIAGNISARHTSDTQVFVNDIAIGGIIGINNAIEGSGGIFAKVNKGDVIKIIVGSAGSVGIAIKFVPHK